MNDRFLAVDWGSTNRRVFLIEDGVVVARERDATGVLAVPAGSFEDEIVALRARFGNQPTLLAGMVGSKRGWVEAGYVTCPATLDMLAAGCVQPEADIAIVPGVSIVEGARADVMRGEEVQLLGASASGMVPADALLCQPGTHCKWARMTGGAIVDFASAMTGELFALLQRHALIGAAMIAPVSHGAAFAEGVAASQDGDLLVKLFGVRPASLLGRRADTAASSFVSGLLIGSDCRAQVVAGERVHVIADTPLGGFYAAAIEALGGTTVMICSQDAFVAGITRIRERTR